MNSIPEGPTFDNTVVVELQERALAVGGKDFALLHLAAAYAGLCDSEKEAETIAAFAYRIMNQPVHDNILEFKTGE